MRRVYAIILVLVLALSLGSPLSEGKDDGKYNTVSGQACGQCHYATSATPSLSGTPTDYSPGQTYSLTMSVSGGTSGTKGGFSLNVDKGSFSNAGTSAKINGGNNKQATHSNSNARSWTLDWTAPSSGSGTVTFSYAALAANGNGQNTGDGYGTGSKQVSESVSNTAPSVSNTQISPSTAYTTDTIQLSYTYSDSDGDGESGTAIRWYKDSSLISSRNDMTSVPSSLTSKGEQWYATVTPSDGTDSGTLETSNTLTIQNSAPTVSSAAISPASPTEDEDLTLNWGGSDADSGDSVSLENIQWFVDGSVVSSFDGLTTLPAVAIRSDDVWHAKVMVNDGTTNSDWFTTVSVTIGSDNIAPNMDSINIGGPYTTTDDITVIWTSSDPDGFTPTIYEINWKKNDVEVSGQTAETLSSEQTSKGESWKAGCRVSDGEAWSDWMWSTAVVISNSPPLLNSFSIDQDTVFSVDEVTYSYDAFDADGDDLTLGIQWSPTSTSDPTPGDVYTMSLQLQDSSGDLSTMLSDTVEITNSLPVANYEGNTSQNSLSDLAPVFSSSDDNDDDVTLIIEWEKNGFATEFNTSTISAMYLAPGDQWVALVTPNDGTDNGETLSVIFTIENLEPVADITTDEQVWVGVPTTLSALDSTDVDGIIVDATWTIDGVQMSGIEVTFVPSSTTSSIDLIIYDDAGGSASTTSTVSASTPPQASNIEIQSEGSQIAISWQGSSSEWAVYRDGAFLGTTDTNSWDDMPPVAGDYTYSINPVIEGVTIPVSQDASASLTTDVVEEAPGPSTTAGMIIGIVMILIGGAGVASSFLPRRD